MAGGRTATRPSLQPGTPHADPVIACRRLTRMYGSRRAVDNLDLEVARGARLAIVGANGAGKTTLMRMLSGSMTPTSGTLSILGIDALARPRVAKSRLGVVPQGITLDTEIRVVENLTTFARYHGRPGPAARLRAEELLEAFDLAEHRRVLAAELSPGMQRRLLIARALINDPEIILLDEPTTGLDPDGRSHVWERLRAMTHRGATLLMTSHHAEDVEQLCDEVLVLDQGHVIGHGPAEQLLPVLSPRARGQGPAVRQAAEAPPASTRVSLRNDDSEERRPALTSPVALAGGRARRSVMRPSPALAARVWTRNAVLFRRSYRTTIVPNFFEPLFLLLAFGYGLGAYVDSRDLHGSFAAFIGPGLLAVSAMNGAVFEVTYNIFVRLRYARSYDAVVTTPVEPPDIGLGELAWALTRCLIYSSVFLAVLAALGYVHSLLALLAPVLITLMGLVFASIGMLFTSQVRVINAYSYFYVLGLTPLTLVSGVFFPSQRLPTAVADVQWFNPLHRGVEMSRALLAGGPAGAVLGNAVWLGVTGLALAWPAIYSLRRHLVA
jgi:Nod factor-specific ABC transporter NodJ protein